MCDVKILSSEASRFRILASELFLSSTTTSRIFRTLRPELGPGSTVSYDVKYFSLESSRVPTSFCSLELLTISGLVSSSHNCYVGTFFLFYFSVLVMGNSLVETGRSAFLRLLALDSKVMVDLGFANSP